MPGSPATRFRSPPYPADDMTAHPVSTHVNRPANDDPRCVEPVTLL